MFLKYALNIINPIYSDDFLKIFANFMTNVQKLGVIGFAYMLFVFTMFFKDYEYIISKIHKTEKKDFLKSLGTYIGFMISIPILFIGYVVILSLYNNDIFIKVISFLFSWFLIFILFKIASSQKIATKVALISSFLTFAALSITKFLFLYYVTYNHTYQTLYGSFSFLLFLFLWIYISWIIYLYGMKLSASLAENK
jgi:membrane protein